MSGTTTGATFDAVGTCGAATNGAPAVSNTAPGVWYTIVGDGSLIFIASTCNAANFDTKISVFSGKCDDLVCVGGIDDTDGCGSTTEIGFDTTDGMVYSILIHGYDTQTGDFVLTLLAAPGVSTRMESSLFGGVGVIR
jgi:hypothetical protein